MNAGLQSFFSFGFGLTVNLSYLLKEVIKIPIQALYISSSIYFSTYPETQFEGPGAIHMYRGIG